MCVACTLAANCGRSSQPAGTLAVAPASVRLGYPQSVPARLDWKPARALDRQKGRPLVFVHLFDREKKPRNLLRTYDYPLAKPWRAGQPLSDEIDLYQSALAQPLPPGRYVLSAGLYDSAGGERWPLDAPVSLMGRMEYRVGSVEVTGPDPSAPAFEMTGAWLPLETGSGKQILARRCLAGSGTLAASGAGSNGSVRMLVSDPLEGPAEVRVTSSCEPSRIETISAGQKWLDFPIAQGGRCEIGFEPAPPAQARPPTQRLPACLDVLSWRPAAKEGR